MIQDLRWATPPETSRPDARYIPPSFSVYSGQPSAPSSGQAGPLFLRQPPLAPPPLAACWQRADLEGGWCDTYGWPPPFCAPNFLTFFLSHDLLTFFD